MSKVFVVCERNLQRDLNNDVYYSESLRTHIVEDVSTELDAIQHLIKMFEYDTLHKFKFQEINGMYVGIKVADDRSSYAVTKLLYVIKKEKIEND